MFRLGVFDQAQVRKKVLQWEKHEGRCSSTVQDIVAAAENTDLSEAVLSISFVCQDLGESIKAKMKKMKSAHTEPQPR